jgi:tRNA A-37 threonylcarbamoyl transferase component Bud32
MLTRTPPLLVNPRYRALLARAGLLSVDRFFALPAVIIGGHRRRHVARITLGSGADAFGAFLKREWDVPWKVYLSNAWEGFGWVSRSYREALTLRALRENNISCPELIAAGEDSQGRAFLLVRELAEAQELRAFLRAHRSAAPSRRGAFARRLGRELARLHEAGFNHADLYAKHVLVGPDRESIHLLDWQRARRWRRLPWKRRLNDLAALDATLADALTSPGERLRCLRAYLRASGAQLPGRCFRDLIARVCRQARWLLRRHAIREVRQACLPIGQQSLVWLDGEALCVTREFHDALHGETPRWLVPDADSGGRNRVREEHVSVPGARQAVLVRRWSYRPLRWLWRRLRGRPLTSPELQQAAALFRLQRHGISTPRLLAVGQRHVRPWRTASFLLAEPPPGCVRLSDWLAASERCAPPYRRLLHEAGTLVRRLHETGTFISANRGGIGMGSADAFAVQQNAQGWVSLVVQDLAGASSCRGSSRASIRRDLRCWAKALAQGGVRRTDLLRFYRGYRGHGRLTPADKRLLRPFVFGARVPAPGGVS